jgi:tripartite-type tricarboxylate transporter receptor subunit TctC
MRKRRARSVKDLIAIARAKPGAVRYASAKRVSSEAAEPVAGTPEAFGQYIVAEIAKWSRIAKEAGIRAE